MRRTVPTTVFVLILAIASPADGGDWSGYVAGELHLFPEAPADGDQHGHSLSLSAEPRYYHEWADRKESLVFKPFLRVDQLDSARTHADIRELYWEKAGDSWQLRVGINKVFWGVTESQHLVDIINQTDFVEDVAGEEKLGQPMINLTLALRWGNLDLFILPGFRERTYPGEEGRLRPPFPVDTDDAQFESGAGAGHVDWAARWSRNAGPWDLALSYFQGTSREPQLRPRFDLSAPIELVPYYDQIGQAGTELQYTSGKWIWKFEGIHRIGQEKSFSAFIAGFEYTMYGAGGSPVDVGLLAEYLYDSRGKNTMSPFDNDLFLGTRIGFNDKQSSELLFGGIVDLETGAAFLSLEASRRLGENWKLSLKARAFAGFSSDDPAHSFERDDHVKLELAWYF